MKIKRPLAALAILIAALCFVATLCFPLALMPRFAAQFASGMEDGDELTVTGRIYKVQKKTYSVYVYLKNSKASADKSTYLHAGKVLLIFPSNEYDEYGFKFGNKITAQCAFLEFNRARNNGNYDEEDYYNSLGIFIKASVTEAEITSHFVNWPAQIMSGFKDAIINSLDEIFGEEDASAKGIFMAILTGDRSALTDGTKNLYSENGISHILAISGLHISIIGMGAFSLLKKIIGPYKSCIICSVMMALYCIMCGMSVSALRAVIMFAVRMGAYFTGKTFDLLSALGLCAIVILIGNPFYIQNSGFMLSFLAILSLGVINKNLSEFLELKKKAARALVSSVCVTAASLSVIARTYCAVPLYGVLLNLIVIPLMSAVLGSALAGGIAGILCRAAGRFFIAAGYYAVYFINLCCYAAQQLPYNSIVTGCPGVFRTVLFYLILCAGVYLMRRFNIAKRQMAAGMFK